MILFIPPKEKDKKEFLFRNDLVKQKDEVVTVFAHHKAFILNRYMKFFRNVVVILLKLKKKAKIFR